MLAASATIAAAAAPPAFAQVAGVVSGVTHSASGVVGSVGQTVSGAVGALTSQPAVSTVTGAVGQATGSLGVGQQPSVTGSSAPSQTGGGGGGTATSSGGGGGGSGAGGGGGQSARSGPGGAGAAAATSGAGGRASAKSRRASARAARARRALSLRSARATTPLTRDPTIARDFRTIVRVIPDAVKALIGALALLAAGFAVRSRVVTRRARRLERQRRELLGDLGLLQRALLPEVPAELPSLAVSVAYRPADGPAAGGDFYDVFALDERRTAIIVGDVMGHGRAALAVTALMRYSLRAYLNAGCEPRLALKVAGRALAGDPDGELTTVVVAVHDASSGTLTYACAGHEPPIVVGDGVHEPVTFWSAPPLGGFMETGQRQTTISLGSDSRVCLFTDGLVETRVGEGLMGREVLTSLVAEEADAERLLDRVAEKAEHAHDDMAACIVRPRVTSATPGRTRIEELEIEAHELDTGRLEPFLAACGVPPHGAGRALAPARALIMNGAPAFLRVTVEHGVARAELGPLEPAGLSIPPLDEARRQMRHPVLSG